MHFIIKGISVVTCLRPAAFSCNVLRFSNQQLRFAGHSKWANIKHVKAAKDGERSRIFDRLGRHIRVAIKEQGSADPKSNSRLAQLIDQARGENMPNDKIQQIIKGAMSSNEDLKPIVLEARGPGGCYFIIEALTNNINRTRANVFHILRRNHSDWGDGALKHSFALKGQVTVDSTLAGQVVDQDAALEHAIAVGAEDVEALYNLDDSKRYQFICDMKAVKEVHTGLKELGFIIKSYGLEYRPLLRVNLSEEQMQVAQIICQKLDDDQDVVKVYDNIA